MAGRRGFILLLSVAAAALLSSCAVQRYMPPGSRLLTSNTVVSDRKVPRDERIRRSDIDQFIRQTPNSQIFGVRLSMAIYCMPRPDPRTWFGRQLRRLGKAPVVFDSVETQRSAISIKNYLDFHGFLDSRVSFLVDTSRRYRAAVTYLLVQGRPFRIRDIDYDFQDPYIRPAVKADSARTLMAPGNVMDLSVLQAERDRIVNNLRQKGFFNISSNSISFEVDTTVGRHRADVTMVVKKFQDGFASDGAPRMVPNPLYRINAITIDPSSPSRLLTDGKAKTDTLQYRGLDILYTDSPVVRPTIFRRNILMSPGLLYNAEDVRITYNKIMRLGFFRSASILFTPAADSLVRPQALAAATVLPPSLDKTAMATPERYLDCNIRCTPGLRHSYKVDLEGSTTASFSSLTTTIGYMNRNLFRGAELFEVNLTGGLEFMYSGNRKTSYEVGASTALTVPHFMLPFEVNRRNRLMNPRTRFDLSISTQNRPFYDRTLSSAALGYSWGNKWGTITYTVRPIDLNLIKLRYIDPAFEEILQQGNPYLADSYASQLVAGISGGIQYVSGDLPGSRSSYTVRFNVETAGNLLRLVSPLGLRRDTTGAYNIFAIPYSQYALASLSFSHRIAISPNAKTAFVYRLLGGYGKAYGNSTAIPNERLFYAGGANSMRGWQARRLGPGSAPIIPSPYPVQRGDMKLEANAELRFPVAGFFRGAVFTDVGNVWQAESGDYDPGAVFHFGTFYNQLGFDAGIGARLDFNFFLLRFDWGLQIHNPNNPAGQRWIQRFTFGQTALTFGVGYPF